MCASGAKRLLRSSSLDKREKNASHPNSALKAEFGWLASFSSGAGVRLLRSEFGNSKNVNCLNPKFWKSEKPLNIQLKNALFSTPKSTVNFEKCRSTFSLWIGYDFRICHFFPLSRGYGVPLRRRGIVNCGGEGRGARPFRNVVISRSEGTYQVFESLFCSIIVILGSQKDAPGLFNDPIFRYLDDLSISTIYRLIFDDKWWIYHDIRRLNRFSRFLSNLMHVIWQSLESGTRVFLACTTTGVPLWCGRILPHLSPGTAEGAGESSRSKTDPLRENK